MTNNQRSKTIGRVSSPSELDAAALSVVTGGTYYEPGWDPVLERHPDGGIVYRGEPDVTYKWG